MKGCIDFFSSVSYLFIMVTKRQCKRGKSCRIQHYIESSVLTILKR